MNIFININNNLYKINKNSIGKLINNNYYWYYTNILINKNNMIFYFYHVPSDNHSQFNDFYNKKEKGIFRYYTELIHFLQKNNPYIHYLLENLYVELHVYDDFNKTNNKKPIYQKKININDFSYNINFNNIYNNITSTFSKFVEVNNYKCFCYFPSYINIKYTMSIVSQIELKDVKEKKLNKYFHRLDTNQTLFKNLFLE
jgi:hypothetical protein